MIRVFSPTDTTYQTNGDIVVKPIRAEIHNADNGDYFLDLVTDVSYVDWIVPNNIVVANTPSGDQPFRIHSTSITSHKIQAKCWHVYYDSENYLIEDSRPTDLDTNNALQWINSATEPASPFSVSSDVPTVSTAYIIRKSLREGIQTILERWGGHIYRDGWNIDILQEVGSDNGVTIRYGKNQKNITVQEDWSNVVTKLMPVGYDGLTLPEVYLLADIQYAIPYTKKITFTQSMNRDDYDNDADWEAALEDDLRDKAEAYLEVNSVPMVNYTVEATDEHIEGLGDVIEVIDERLGINITTNVISYIYDCILEKFREIEFGNFKPTLNGLVSTINQQTQETVDAAASETKNIFQGELEAATASILGVMGNSYVIYDGDKILIVDSLPKETATYAIRINAGGIGFSTTGIDPDSFVSAWKIDGTFDASAINVMNLSADSITSGTLRLGNVNNQSGLLKVYDENGNEIASLDKDGLTVNNLIDGTFVRLNGEVGFAGYDPSQDDGNGNPLKVYWADGDQFHMRQAFVENEITLAYRMRFIPITVDDGNGNIINDGVGIVSVEGD